MKRVLIGSRGSPLALWQARFIGRHLEGHHPGMEVRIEVVRTSGDKLSAATPARGVSTKGLFVKEIEEALLDRKIDLAVHSLKDLPAELPAGLCIGAVPAREDPRDALVGRRRIRSLEELARGARLGTSSLRRTVQLHFLRPDLTVEPIRGNVDTRIRKMKEQALEGVVLAVAGLRRLQLEESISYIFPIDQLVPAIGQGALALEIREDDEEVGKMVLALEDAVARRCTDAERLFLRRLGGGCQVPMGAHASLQDSQGTFLAFVSSPDGGNFVRKVAAGKASEIDELALSVAEDLLCHGAQKLLKQSAQD